MFDDHIREAREHLLRVQERIARDAVAQQQMLTAKLASTSRIPSFSGVRAIKESKGAGNLSEKNRKEPIKWAQVYDVREGVEY